jgi:putative transposase
VPSGLKRYYGDGDLHFITGSCYHREPLLGSKRRRDLFLKVLERVRRRYRFVVLGYVVMPEHFHLLISDPEVGNPSVVIQSLKLGVVRRLFFSSGNKRAKSETRSLFEDSGPARLWQHRFYDFNVWSEKKRIEKLRYMHRNPVKRGLVDAPDQWPWSSFRSYAYQEPGAVRINDWSVLAKDGRTASEKPTSRQSARSGAPM